MKFVLMDLRDIGKIRPPFLCPRILRKRLRPFFSPEGLNMVDKLLVVDPESRMTISDAKIHPFFEEEPLPSSVKEAMIKGRRKARATLSTRWTTTVFVFPYALFQEFIQPLLLFFLFDKSRAARFYFSK